MCKDRSQAGSASVRGGFVFINKTSTNWTNTTDEVWAVASHASKTHRRQHKKRTVRPCPGTKEKSILPRPILPSISAVIASQIGTINAQRPRPGERSAFSSYLQIKPNVVTKDGVSNSKLLIESQEDYPDVLTSTAFHLQKSQAKSDKRHDHVCNTASPMFWKGNSDPFAVAALPLGPSEHEVLHFAKRFYVFVAKPSDKNAVWRSPISDFRSS
jgi:hypothetical protein